MLKVEYCVEGGGRGEQNSKKNLLVVGLNKFQMKCITVKHVFNI